MASINKKHYLPVTYENASMAETATVAAINILRFLFGKSKASCCLLVSSSSLFFSASCSVEKSTSTVN